MSRILKWTRVAIAGLGFLTWTALIFLFPGDELSRAMLTSFLKIIPRFCCMKPKSSPHPADSGA